MSVAGVQFKVMPESPDTDLESVKAKAQEVIETFESGKFSSSEEVPIAFGLKSLTITFAVSESVETDEIQNKIQEIDGVSSVELIDYRRAVG